MSEIPRTLELARKRHGAYTGCRGKFMLEGSHTSDVDNWRCDDCGTIISITGLDAEALPACVITTTKPHPTPPVEPLSDADLGAYLYAEKRAQMKTKMMSWVWCGCNGRKLCTKESCTNHKDAP